MADKVAYTTKAGVNKVEREWAGGLVAVEDGKTFETDDPHLQEWLDEHDDVKRADKDGK